MIMIVDFTVKNFRSIKEEQTLSFYAERNLSHLPSQLHQPSNDVDVLASAGIYGANAAGKSNVLKALNNLCWIIRDSHDLKEGSKIPVYEPFRLSSSCKSMPTEFSIEFVCKGTRYLYQVAYDHAEIVFEKLEFYSVSKTRTVPAKIFERTDHARWDEITFGGYYKGGSKKIPLFKNQSYLSKAGNTADSPQLIRDIYQYFLNKIVFLKPNHYLVEPEWKKDPNKIKLVSEFLGSIDIGIKNLVIKHEKSDELLKGLPPNIPELLKRKIIEDASNVPYFERSTEEGEIESFTLNDESDGTKTLFLSLPLLFSVLQSGNILVWDELDSSLHPHIVELILELFNDAKANINHAQLLFTTHNIILMNSEKMRKDQLWLTEKKSGATELISLDEFSSSQLKQNSPFDKWYNDGRLGGLPHVNHKKIKDVLAALLSAESQYG